MQALLDTHTFLWWILDDDRLSDTVRGIIQNRENDIYFSAASAWEIAIKTRLGKLSIPTAVETFVPEQLQKNTFVSLPISLHHALAVAGLPELHRDPFDRILVVQSVIEKIPILTLDSLIMQYQVTTIWK